MYEKINVINSHQKDQIVYLGYLSKEQAKRLIFADHFPKTESSMGYQRPPDKKRARSFAKYINDCSSGYITPILLNARETIRFEGNNDFGTIFVPKKKCLSIIDGQHRSIGVIEYLNDELPIPFMLFKNLDMNAEQELFITINREQKKVSMSHMYFFNKDDFYSKLVVKLEEDPESPWYKNIRLVDVRGTNRPVSLNSIRNTLIELLKSGQIKYRDFDTQYYIVIDFWKTVGRVWPEAWNASKKSLLKKAAGALGLSKLGGNLVSLCFDEKTAKLDCEKLYTYLNKASHINWMSDGDFMGFGGRAASDLIKDKLEELIYKKD